ncbi:MAG TPA: CDP-alcohol phosphatidyltransferase family protein [Polyangiales bacterium]|nr:CDP-alcohol phosphatidyltransferase family protein [Polyangiales bacterium]
MSQIWQIALHPLILRFTLHATLILTAASRAAGDFLGLPVGMRVALSLAQAGVTELSLFGPDADRLSEEFRRDGRLSVPIQAHRPDQVVDLVCFDDAFVAPELVRELGLGEGLRDARGQVALLRVRPIRIEDPQSLLTSGEATPPRASAALLRLNDRGDRKLAQRQLFAALVKPSDGPVSRHLNRHVSRAITRLVIPLGMTPNQMTVFVLITGLWGAYAASSPSPASQLFGAFLYQMHSIIDGCDGEIARLTQRFGKHGALIDSMVDDLCNGAFFFGLSLGVARMTESTWPLATGSLTALAYAGVIALQYSAVLRATGRGDKTKFWAAPPARFSVFDLFRALLRRDVSVLLILFAVALGLQQATVAVFPLAALGALVASSLRLTQSNGAV